MVDTPPPSRFRGLPPHVQTASFWLDDSGSRGSAHKGFVIAGIKTRHPDDLQRSLQVVREHHGYEGELKFNAITERNLPRFHAIIDVLEGSDAHLLGAVLDAHRWNPFRGKEHWVGQATVVSQLVCTAMNANEVGAVFMDGISTPLGVSMGALVKRKINSQLRGQRATSVVSLDSKTNDLMQVADLVAGSIRYQRFDPAGPLGDSPKSRFALRLGAAFGVGSFDDRQARRIRIQTLTAEPTHVPRHRKSGSSRA
ncbi:DUF3800 domain-containing protein [Nocardioides sp. ChNu-99]|uniref:DUF3800 domain-containing protein n=1 Tax=Nocardioides sp. ChNu-99 TaxID=2839897 RepID=UPI002406ED51|nr:DUF3800 domain-containing protein [Nocardioides sp. ChNu-99]MDF9715849.1 DUF3800 domain-containing protein [Nocardioides sp. ChNu-99]